MKKVLSLALVASLMLGTAAVKAETQTTDLVMLYDFNSLTAGTIDDAGLSDLGITSSTDGNAEMSIVDLSEDTTYGSLGKVLQYKPTSATSEAGVQTTYIQFPMSYELNSDETLVVEYDFKYVEKEDWFGQAPFGSVGLNDIGFYSGGNGMRINSDLHSGTRPYLEVVHTHQSKDPADWTLQRDWTHMKLVYDYEKYMNSETGSAMYYSRDVLKSELTALAGTPWDIKKTAMTNLTFGDKNGTGCVQIDNIHVYTIPKFRLTGTSIEDGETGVFCDTKTVTAQFTNDIADASAVTVSKDGAQISASEYSVSKSGNTVTVTFANDLTYSSNYVISYTGITDTLGQTLDEKTVSFTVEPMPDIMLGSLKLAKGIGAAYEEVSELNASNGLQSISLDLENTTSEAKNVNVIFALYEGESRVLSSMQHIETSIPANETKEVSIGVDMTDSQGKLVKAFVWDTFSSMKPWIGNTQLEVK